MNGQMSRVFQVQTTGRFEIEDFAEHIRHFVPGYDRLSHGTRWQTFRKQHRAKACCEKSRRDGAIVAWHEVPGKAPPQESRPVGVRCDFAQVWAPIGCSRVQEFTIGVLVRTGWMAEFMQSRRIDEPSLMLQITIFRVNTIISGIESGCYSTRKIAAASW